MSRLSLSRKVALVTGAASGIGLATARRLAADGALVAMVDRDKSALADAVVGAEEPLRLCIDVAERGPVAAAVAEVAERCGGIDVLVNSAAIVEDWGLPADVPASTWTEVLAVNLLGTVNVCNAAIPLMGRGAIVNTSSICGTARACPTRAPYDAAKAGIVAFTRDLAAAYGPRGLRANVVVPGFIDSPMSRRLVVGREEGARAEERRIPLRRIGQPEEVAELTAFLAGDAASYLTGSVIFVDGGLSLV
jgi:NAD(P)-dependent dehydrogenase (short-subunit alcohol dehydrogenase family)